MSIITPIARVSFPNVFSPSDMSGKYEIVLVFTPDQDISVLREAANLAVQEKWGSEVPSNLKNPFRQTSEKPEYYGDFPEGSVFVTFRSQNPPGVVDQKRQPVQPGLPSDCWSGTVVLLCRMSQCICCSLSIHIRTRIRMPKVLPGSSPE